MLLMHASLQKHWKQTIHWHRWSYLVCIGILVDVTFCRRQQHWWWCTSHCRSIDNKQDIDIFECGSYALLCWIIWNMTCYYRSKRWWVFNSIRRLWGYWKDDWTEQRVYTTTTTIKSWCRTEWYVCNRQSPSTSQMPIWTLMVKLPLHKQQLIDIWQFDMICHCK